MFSRFCQKTSASRGIVFRLNERGQMMIVSVFLFLTFSTLALGMIFLSQVYLRLAGYRKNALLLECSSENGIKDGLNRLLQSAAKAAAPAPISEENYASLRDSAQTSGVAVLEDLIEILFPVEVREEAGEITWTSVIDCRLDEFVDAESCFAARFLWQIESTGKLRNFVPQKTSTLDGQVELLAGRLPLPFFSFLLCNRRAAETKEEFAVENNISLHAAGASLIPPQPVITQDELIPQDALPLLAKALQIKIFSPQDLTPAKLRSVLGLEASAEPVPEGVYLIRTDLGLGGVFVQGDVEEMGLAVEDSYQVISFRMEAGRWKLAFSPAAGRTVFTGPVSEEVFDVLPLGIIMVTGKILSLGGGVSDAEEGVRLVRDQEIPCLVRGVNLTIVAAEKISLSSHLIREGVKWAAGIPYIKEEQAQLIIYSTGRDIVRGESVEGGVVIAEDAPQGIKIQASIAAQGSGFRILGEQREIHLLGGLQAVDYESGGSALHLTALPPETTRDMLSMTAPRTMQPLVSLSQFKALDWKEE